MPLPLHLPERPLWAARSARLWTMALLLALLTATGCDDDPGSSPAASATTASPTAAAAGGSAASAAGGGAPQTASTRATGGGDGSVPPDGPPTASGTAQTTAPPTATTPTKPTATAPTKPTASSTPTVAATPSLPATTTPPPLPTVDPATLPPAKPGSADAMAARVDEIYKPLKRFRARFEQTYRAKVAGVTKKSTGLVLVHRPSKLSMRYDPPNNNRVVSDGSTVKVYEADNKQMFVQPVARTEYPGALAFIMGKGLRPSFRFVFHDKAKFAGGKVLLGTPRVSNPAYEKVFFYIDQALLDRGDPATVRRVLVLDAQSNRNRFDFTKISEPSQIDPKEFVFQAPPGTTLVK